MDIDLSEYMAGGYFITKYADRPEYLDAGLLPERLVSLSECIGSSVQIYWGWDLDKHRQEALQFGILSEKLNEFAAWILGKGRTDIDFPGVFYSIEAARRFVAEFLPVKDGLLIIGIALPESLVDGFLNDNQQTVYNANTQEYIQETYGINLALSERKPLPPNGEILGFEVVSYYYNLDHSWLCSGLERDMHQKFGIRPGQYGLIETFEDANRVHEWILEGEAKGEHRGEPEPYYPWLIARYPLE